MLNGVKISVVAIWVFRKKKNWKYTATNQLWVLSRSVVPNFLFYWCQFWVYLFWSYFSRNIVQNQINFFSNFMVKIVFNCEIETDWNCEIRKIKKLEKKSHTMSRNGNRVPNVFLFYLKTCCKNTCAFGIFVMYHKFSRTEFH